MEKTKIPALSDLVLLWLQENYPKEKFYFSAEYSILDGDSGWSFGFIGDDVFAWMEGQEFYKVDAADPDFFAYVKRAIDYTLARKYAGKESSQPMDKW